MEVTDFRHIAVLSETLSGTAFVTDRSGVTTISKEGITRFVASPVKAAEPTGAGDAFAGGVVGHEVTRASFSSAVNAGLALAALTVCSSSSSGILPLSQHGRVHTL
jgi:sugar/nucleoside kinase (ribokinase family)